jgi:hypothetical protein
MTRDRYAGSLREFRTRCNSHSGPGRAERAKRYWQPAKGLRGNIRGGAPWLLKETANA